jgi:hypothetical protein
MHATDVSPTGPRRHGAYLCLTLPADARARVAGLPMAALAARLGLQNEFGPASAPAAGTLAFLRRVAVQPGTVADDGLAAAAAVVHVASTAPGPVEEFGRALAGLLGPASGLRVLAGEERPPAYTGAAMHDFAYAHRVLQQPGPVMPNAFLLPLSKTADWWAKGWMERHTYFLPRFDDAGRRLTEGHALAAAAGIPCLLRRTYRHAAPPAPPGSYDFLTYFECADAAVPTFHAVCAALRDVARNPEWRFVREGPTWHGRRVATWSALFT